MEFSGKTSRKNFAVFAWIVLAYNIPVILWGAYVRVSFSGDGCGAHWPFCNGQVIPRNMAAPMAIEFTHRLMTSVDSFATTAMCIWAFLSFPQKHAVRFYSILALLFLLVEALLGAGLVLFRYVARDQSAGRAWYLSAHLTNTLLLLAALTATAWLADANRERLRLSSVSRAAIGALVVTIIVSVTGAIAALGDTLFPAPSLSAGMQQDFSNTSNMLLRLRTVHPLIAMLGAAYLIGIASRVLRRAETGGVRTAATRVLGMTLLQLLAGAVNLSLLAPVWMQLCHLFLADVLWIAVVVLVLEMIAVRRIEPALVQV